MLDKSASYKTAGEIAKEMDMSATRLRNYADMQVLDTMQSNGKRFINTASVRSSNREADLTDYHVDEVKKIVEFTDILSEYFPIDYLKQSAYDSFHADMLKFLEKHKIVNKEVVK